MLCHFVPIVAVALSLAGLSTGTPVSGIADASAPESKAVLTPRGASDAWRPGHLSAQTPDSPVLHDVVTDAESPAHCVCDGTTVPLRRGGHCECIKKHSKRAPPGLHHDVVTDAESPAHCVCPGSEVPVRYGDGHCDCVAPRFKRENDPVAKSSEAPSKAAVTASKSTVTASKSTVTASKSNVIASKSTVTASKSTVIVSKSTVTVSKSTVTASKSIVIASKSTVTASKSTVTVSKSIVAAPKLSVTGSSTFITTKKSSTTQQNSSKSTAKATVTVKPISPSATVQSVTATVSVVATTDAEFLPDIEVPVKLPLLTGPVLVCLFGGCFPSNELSSVTSSFGKRAENRNLADLPYLKGSCDEDNILLCTKDHRTCFCHISKRSMPEDSVAHQCPDNQLLVCGVSSCSCVEIPPKPLSPVPASCSTGALICFEGLCYCPLVTGRRPESGIRPEGLGP